MGQRLTIPVLLIHLEVTFIAFDQSKRLSLSIGLWLKAYFIDEEKLIDFLSAREKQTTLDSLSYPFDQFLFGWNDDVLRKIDAGFLYQFSFARSLIIRPIADVFTLEINVYSEAFSDTVLTLNPFHLTSVDPDELILRVVVRVAWTEEQVIADDLILFDDRVVET